jgi:hypothetical protein
VAGAKGSALRATLFGSLAAGPVFLLSYFVAGAVAKLAARDPYWAPNVGELLSLLVPSLVVGFFLALIPNALGTIALTALGRHAAEARHPLVWTTVGAAFGMLIALLFGGGFNPAAADWPVAMAITGAVCARICRAFARVGD